MGSGPSKFARGSKKASHALAEGFTLLEVMVSLAILAVSLVAILNLHSGAVRMHNHAKFLTVATLLARSKMVDLEEKIYAEDLSSFDETLEGNFNEEGYPGFQWSAELVKPELSLDSGLLEGLIGQALGLDLGDPGAASGAGAGGFGSSGGGSGPTGAGGGGGLMGMLGGGLQGMITSQLASLQTLIEDGVREVRLTLRWTDITGPSDLTVVTHVVKLPGQNTPGGAADLQNTTSRIIQDTQKRLGGLPNLPFNRAPMLPTPSARSLNGRLVGGRR